MLYTDLVEIKALLEIDPNNTSEDKKLNFLVEMASSFIEEVLNRKMSFALRSEIYSGTGTQKMLLRSRPVFTTPTITISFDPSAYFGSSPNAFQNSPPESNLVYGKDFCLQIDQPDGSSRSGILYRINDYWYKPYVRQTGLLSPFIGTDTGSYLITYQAGYTVDTLPADFRLACNLLVSKLRYIFPLGVELSSESYEERAIALITNYKDYLLALVRPMILKYRNWKF